MKKIHKSLKDGLNKILGLSKNEIYIDLIKSEFDFLVQEYGFSMEEKISYDDDNFGQGTITYYSDTFIIEVYKGRVDEIYITVKSISVVPQTTLFLNRILEYRTNRAFTSENFHIKTKGDKYVRIPFFVIQYANLFRKYCEPLLQGDTSWWPNAEQYAQDESDKINRSLGVKNPR